MKSKAGSLSGLTKLTNPLQDKSRKEKRYKPSISEIKKRIALQYLEKRKQREKKGRILQRTICP